MIRALWTAASGMMAQQLNVDNVANNLANVNTTAFKKSRVTFKDLLYETIVAFGPGIVGMPMRGDIQVGHGVRTGSMNRNFGMGPLESTGNDLDIAIEGDGFFAVEGPGGETLYTRDGSFQLDGEGYVVTAEGYRLLAEGSRGTIRIPDDATRINIAADGTVTVTTTDGNQDEVGQIQLVRFINPAGLEALGNNVYRETQASGQPSRGGIPGEDGLGKLAQGYLERSNVQIVEEMVNLITAQRAYELNSKAVQAADEMLSMANNLKR